MATESISAALCESSNCGAEAAGQAPWALGGVRDRAIMPLGTYPDVGASPAGASGTAARAAAWLAAQRACPGP